MVMLDRIARRYGVRPSELVGETSGPAAFSIDLHATKWGVFQDNVEARDNHARMNHGR